MFLILAYLITAFTLWDITWILNSAQFEQGHRLIVAIVVLVLTLLDIRLWNEIKSIRRYAKRKAKGDS